MREAAGDPGSAFAFCTAVTRRRAKNFYYAFFFLDRERKAAIHALYAYGRLLDDIADDDGAPLPLRRERLSQLRLALGAALDLRAEAAAPRWPGHPDGSADLVLAAVGAVARRYDVRRDDLEELLEGVEQDLFVDRYETFGELREYCYKVASTVGLLCIAVFGYEDPAARDYAVDLGLAMQVTNILRDVAEDLDRGRIYLPREDLARFGVAERDLLARRVDERFRALMAFEADRARAYFASGARLLPLLRPGPRSCPAALAAIYGAVLEKIDRRRYDVFRGRARISALEKVGLALVALLGSSLDPDSIIRRTRKWATRKSTRELWWPRMPSSERGPGSAPSS